MEECTLINLERVQVTKSELLGRKKIDGKATERIIKR